MSVQLTLLKSGIYDLNPLYTYIIKQVCTVTLHVWVLSFNNTIGYIKCEI